MRRRKLRWVAGLTLVALVGTGAFVLWPREERSSLENFRRLRVGMSRAEVRAIIGPPGDYYTNEPEVDDSLYDNALGSPKIGVERAEDFARREFHEGNRGAIAVDYDPEGNLTWANCYPFRPVDHGPLGNLVWRIKYEWRKWFPEE